MSRRRHFVIFSCALDLFHFDRFLVDFISEGPFSHDSTKRAAN